MRLSLTMTEEGARLGDGAAVEAAPPLSGPQRKGRQITVQDVKDFLLAYCACFVAVSIFIA